MTHVDNNGISHELPDLLPCPFCASEPTLTCIGNRASGSIKVEIKCPGCRIVRRDAAIYRGFDWLLNVAVCNWNRRMTTSNPPEAGTP